MNPDSRGSFNTTFPAKKDIFVMLDFLFGWVDLEL